MRIVCDSCSATYQFADEKIAGKLFRVRCKKCSNMIMVDGTQLGGAVSAAAGVSSGDSEQAVWYVVIDGSQTGPLNEAELSAQVAQGLIDSDTYAWKEGMADWLRMSDVPALSDLVPSSDGFGGEATQVVSSDERPVAGGAASASGGFLVGSLSDVVPMRGESGSAAPVGAASPGPAERVSGSGLLAAAAADSARSPLSGSSVPRASAEDTSGGFTAERNESSVLFSLSDLTAPKSQPRGGDAMPRTEGSGLIDIRTLASAQAALAPPTQSDAGFASPGAIGAPVPTMAPMALPPRRQSAAPYIALGALMVVIVLLLVLLLMNRNQPAPVPVAEPTQEQPAADEAVANVATPEAPAAEATATAEVVPAVEEPPAAVAEGSAQAAVEGSGQTELAAVVPSPPVDAPTEVAAARDTPPVEPVRSGASESPERQAPPREAAREPSPPSERTRSEPTASREEPPTPPRREETRDSDAVAAALAAIQGSNEPAAEPVRTTTPVEEPAAPAAPTSLARSDVQGTIRRYNSRIARCTEYGEAGTYPVSFSIQRDGSVSGVSPGSSDDVSNCVAGVVRAMTFPRFTGDPIPVTYPFVLR